MARKLKTKPKARGQMQPFKPDSLALIRAKLKAHGDLRQLALLAAGIDTCLRSDDLLKLTVADVTDHLGEVRERFAVTQGKVLGRPISVALTPGTRDALAAFITASGKLPADYLFTPAGRPHGRHITTAMLRRVVKSWCGIANLDPRHYSGHSLRRTKPAHVYVHTRNVAAVSKMLGHTNLANTLGYLAITDNEVADLALRFEV
jgi:integrase